MVLLTKNIVKAWLRRIPLRKIQGRRGNVHPVELIAVPLD
jgi:hypothetical protein